MTLRCRLAIVSVLALLWAVAGCTSPAPTPTPQPVPTPTPAAVSLRIAYTSDSLGHTDPVAAVGCG